MRRSAGVLLLLTVSPLLIGARETGAQETKTSAPKPTKTGASNSAAASPVASYGVGWNIGRNLRNDGMAFDLKQLYEGIQDALNDQPARYPEEQVRDALLKLQQQIIAMKQEQARVAGEQNKAAGESYMVKVDMRPTVKKTKSGLRYEVLKQGDGAAPKPDSQVQVTIQATLIDGTVIDSTLKRGKADVVKVNGVIKGWSEALQLMKVGDKWRLYLIPELAYGDNGIPNVIGPKSVVVFEVELLGIDDPK